MAMSNSGQKFIARNRAPRVQIEYDVEIYGAERKIQLPFVMGVMADLVGKPVENLPAVDERKFLEIDIDNFDERMKALKPRVAFQVDNTLTGEGKLNVTELTYNGKAELPVFANSYTEPAAPAVVDEPEDVLPQTGDTLPTLLAGVAAVAVVALAVLGFAAFKLRRGKNAHRMK